MSKILIGSKYFFKDIEGFNSKDTDEIEIVESGKGKFNYIMLLTYPNRCHFKIVHRPKKELIEYALSKSPAMGIGKFLIPEFNKEFDITIDDLKLLKPLIDKLDTKHLYEKIIYDAYIANNDFILTDDQRNAAYELYKTARENDTAELPKITHKV